jgi:hypothetical protein
MQLKNTNSPIPTMERCYIALYIKSEGETILESIEITLENGIMLCPLCGEGNKNKYDLAEHMEGFHKKKIQYRSYVYIDKGNGTIGAIVLEC